MRWLIFCIALNIFYYFSIIKMIGLIVKLILMLAFNFIIKLFCISNVTNTISCFFLTLNKISNQKNWRTNLELNGAKCFIHISIKKMLWICKKFVCIPFIINELPNFEYNALIINTWRVLRSYRHTHPHSYGKYAIFSQKKKFDFVKICSFEILISYLLL